MTVPHDDQVLIQRIQSGDAEAFGELFYRHKDDTFKFARNRLHNRSAAEDIWAEAWEKTFAQLSQGNHVDNVVGYVTTAIMNGANSHLRREGRVIDVGGDIETAVSDPGHGRAVSGSVMVNRDPAEILADEARGQEAEMVHAQFTHAALRAYAIHPGCPQHQYGGPCPHLEDFDLFYGIVKESMLYGASADGTSELSELYQRVQDLTGVPFVKDENTSDQQASRIDKNQHSVKRCVAWWRYVAASEVEPEKYLPGPHSEHYEDKIAPRWVPANERKTNPAFAEQTTSLIGNSRYDLLSYLTMRNGTWNRNSGQRYYSRSGARKLWGRPDLRRVLKHQRNDVATFIEENIVGGGR
jgi:RNA polymerase sigma-70 factor (ECF subfamily)